MGNDARTAISEADFQATVREMAELFGWTVFLYMEQPPESGRGA